MNNKKITDEAVMIELNRLKTDTYPTTDFDRRDAALERAKQAVRKQIPRKPEPEPKWYGVGRCPTCRAVFCDASTNYCGNCGQALDWGR